MRYKQGTGCPVQFMAFLGSRNIPLKEFPRYVGNRMHVIFHLAGSVVFYRSELLTFLREFCKARGGLTASLAKDLEDPSLIEQLKVLALVGKSSLDPG